MKRNRLSILNCIFLVPLLLLVFNTLASADPFLWTLSGANFNGGGNVTGSFIFDPDTNTYDFADLASGGTAYSYVDPSSTSSLLKVEANPGGANGDPAVWLFFGSSLGAGGSVSLTDAAAGTCFSSCSALLNSGSGTVGGVTGVAAGSSLWILNGVDFNLSGNNGGVTGLFTFDPEANLYDFADLASGGTAYSYVDPSSTSSLLKVEANPGGANGDPAVWLFFASSLTNGGPVSLTFASAGTCFSSCSALGAPGRGYVGNVGEVTQPFPAPEPGSFALDGIGFFVLATYLRSRLRSAKPVIV